MAAEIAEGQEAMRKRYVASKRHTIQVDGPPYMRQLAAGAAPTSRGRSDLPGRRAR